MKLELSAQVVEFVRLQAPEPRRRLRNALRKLALEKGDLRALEGELAGFYRLRAGRYRIIFWYRTIRGERVIRCEFAEERSIVYQVFAEIVSQLRAP